jgi:hypothetical protein
MMGSFMFVRKVSLTIKMSKQIYEMEKHKIVEYYVLMYKNRKRRPVETIPGMGGVGIKEDDGREFNYDVL